MLRFNAELSRTAVGHGAVLITRLDYSLAGAGPRTEDGAGNQLETLGGLASDQSSPALQPLVLTFGTLKWT